MDPRLIFYYQLCYSMDHNRLAVWVKRIGHASGWIEVSDAVMEHQDVPKLGQCLA